MNAWIVPQFEIASRRILLLNSFGQKWFLKKKIKNNGNYGFGTKNWFKKKLVLFAFSDMTQKVAAVISRLFTLSQISQINNFT